MILGELFSVGELDKHLHPTKLLAYHSKIVYRHLCRLGCNEIYYLCIT